MWRVKIVWHRAVMRWRLAGCHSYLRFVLIFCRGKVDLAIRYGLLYRLIDLSILLTIDLDSANWITWLQSVRNWWRSDLIPASWRPPSSLTERLARSHLCDVSFWRFLLPRNPTSIHCDLWITESIVTGEGKLCEGELLPARGPAIHGRQWPMCFLFVWKGIVYWEENPRHSTSCNPIIEKAHSEE